MTPAVRDILFSGPPGWVLRGTVPADLDFDFANGRYWQRGIGYRDNPDDLLTCSRASTGYINNTDGFWDLVASNKLRWRAGVGLLVEEARIGSVLFSSNLTTSNWTATAGSLVQGGAGPIVGQNISTFTGNGASAAHFINPAANASPYVSGQSYTLGAIVRYSSSRYVQLTHQGGAFGVSQYATFDLLNGTIVSGSTAGGTAYMQKYSNGYFYIALVVQCSSSLTGTGGNLALSNGNNSRLPSYASSDSVIVAYLNNEAGLFPTSPIITTGTAATRATDVVSLLMQFGAEYTAFVAATPNAPDTNTSLQNAVTISDGTSNNRFMLRHVFTEPSSIAPVVGLISGGAQQFTGNVGAATWLAGTKGRLAMAGRANDQRAAFAGILDTNSYSTSMPVGSNSIQIGSNPGGTFSWNGYVSRVAMWSNSRQPDAALQAFTR